MRFDIKLVASAQKDLGWYRTSGQRVILKAVFKYLRADADVETKKRKQLRPNPLAPWELRIGNYRVFYEIAENRLVRVLSIGHKVHNDLFVQGERVEL